MTYVTKMKKSLVYTVESDRMYMSPTGLVEYREQHVTFTKHVKDGEDIVHHARIVTCVDIKKTRVRLVSLLTNYMEMEAEDIVAIYRKRWEIELLFKQLKQNFPLRYFYGESANAIKIQIWVTLIANLLLMVIQKRIKRTWSFSGLATMFRIMLMYYVNCYTFFEEPERTGWRYSRQRIPHHQSKPYLTEGGGLLFQATFTIAYLLAFRTSHILLFDF